MPARYVAEDTRPVSDYESACAWTPPAVRFRVYGGQKMRLYACQVCRDAGVVRLPNRTAEETDQHLIGFCGCGVVYHCPACRPEAARFRPCRTWEQVRAGQVEQTDGQYRRLQHWLTLKRAEIAKGAEEEALGHKVSLRQVYAAAKGVFKPMPGLPEAEQAEIGARQREAQ